MYLVILGPELMIWRSFIQVGFSADGLAASSRAAMAWGILMFVCPIGDVNQL